MTFCQHLSPWLMDPLPDEVFTFGVLPYCSLRNRAALSLLSTQVRHCCLRAPAFLDGADVALLRSRKAAASSLTGLASIDGSRCRVDISSNALSDRLFMRILKSGGFCVQLTEDVCLLDMLSVPCEPLRPWNIWVRLSVSDPRQASLRIAEFSRCLPREREHLGFVVVDLIMVDRQCVPAGFLSLLLGLCAILGDSQIAFGVRCVETLMWSEVCLLREALAPWRPGYVSCTNVRLDVEDAFSSQLFAPLGESHAGRLLPLPPGLPPAVVVLENAVVRDMEVSCADATDLTLADLSLSSTVIVQTESLRSMTCFRLNHAVWQRRIDGVRFRSLCRFDWSQCNVPEIAMQDLLCLEEIAICRATDISLVPVVSLGRLPSLKRVKVDRCLVQPAADLFFFPWISEWPCFLEAPLIDLSSSCSLAHVAPAFWVKIHRQLLLETPGRQTVCHQARCFDEAGVQIARTPETPKLLLTPDVAACADRLLQQIDAFLSTSITGGSGAILEFPDPSCLPDRLSLGPSSVRVLWLQCRSSLPAPQRSVPGAAPVRAPSAKRAVSIDLSACAGLRYCFVRCGDRVAVDVQWAPSECIVLWV